MRLNRHMKKWLIENRGFIAFLLVFGLFRTAVADWNPIPSASMHPTLLEGDVVFVNRLAFDLKVPLSDIIVAHIDDPRRGDIVTFSSPRDGTRLIKRLIAVPGDVVSMRSKALFINGVAATYEPVDSVLERLGETWQAPATRVQERIAERSRLIQWLPLASSKDSFDAVTVPEDHYLMLGDNRDNSLDSRSYGLVPRHLLIGRAHHVLVSADIEGNWQPRFGRFWMKLD
jgi:signal peptidase I